MPESTHHPQTRLNLVRHFASLTAMLFFALTAIAQPHLPITEKIEWTWTDRPDTPSTAPPNVLLVGDSITRAYYPEVAKQLSGEANVYLFATSASSGDPRLPQQLGAQIANCADFTG
jgi:hypothetical protein